MENFNRFEAAFVISLDITPRKREWFLAQMKSQTEAGGFAPLPVIEVYPAIHGDTCQPPDNWNAGAGAWGCYKSHVNILEQCLNRGIGSYIVFEDDCQFRPNFLNNVYEFMRIVPDDWEQIYFGGQLQHENTHPPIKVASNESGTLSVYRPYNVNRTHCYAVSKAGMLPIYRHISTLPFWDRDHIDHHLGRWHEDPATRVYCPGKWFVGQHGFPSNVSGKSEDVQYYPDPETAALSHPLLDNPVCIVYRGSKQLLFQARQWLHTGNQTDMNGIDITLAFAAKMKEPATEVNKWYQWIRTEIIRGKTTQLPCMNHPAIDETLLHSLGIKTETILYPKSLEEIKQVVDRVRPK